MRLHPALLFVALGAAVAGCGARSTMSPDATSTASASRGDTFVLESITDSRLPAPGTELAGVTDADRALVSRVPAAPEVVSLSQVPDAVEFWNLLTESLATGAKLPPPLYSRAYAYVHVAIYDAVSLAGDGRRGNISQRSLAAGAAEQVLLYLFPGSADLIHDAAAEQMSADGGASSLGAFHLGTVVGGLTVRRAQSDGSTAVFTGTPPTGPDIWTGTNPVLPMAGTWKTWCVSSGASPAPEPPYAFLSDKDLADVQEVLDVSQNRTPEMIAIVHKWADTSPPAIWNDMLNGRVQGGSFSTVAAARAYAYLNVAMEDAFVCCWNTKYQYWVARPFQRIPGLVTVIPTPNFPTYTSGHSTISAAAAEVMAQVFPSDAPFFRDQAAEAAISRLWSGIHFRHDNEQGAVVGKEVGEITVARMLQPGGRPLFASR
jgi:hypothetical protein